MQLTRKKSKMQTYKRRIGVVTWMGGGNYGTTLQSYALCAFLKNNGYFVCFFSHRVNRSYKGYIKKLLFKLGLYNLIKKNQKRESTNKEIKLKAFQAENYYNPICFTERDFCSIISKMDVFVTGSDQIWNTYYKFDPFFFLDFVQNKKRIAYASSIGTNDIKEECREDVKNLLNKFLHIGVRENSAVKVLRDLLPEKEIVQVLDPTFLLTQKDWESFSSKAQIEIEVPNRYILCYLIGKRIEYAQQLEDVRNQYGIDKIVFIPSAENPDVTIQNAIIYKSAGPFEFVNLLIKSTLVCTDSFHATALAINANKNFVEFMRFDNNDKQSQNSRIYDVLSHYGLSERIYNSGSKGWIREICYNDANKTLELDRKKSIDFLINAIEN